MTVQTLVHELCTHTCALVAWLNDYYLSPAAGSEVIKSMEHVSLHSLGNMGAADVGV